MDRRFDMNPVQPAKRTQKVRTCMCMFGKFGKFGKLVRWSICSMKVSKCSIAGRRHSAYLCNHFTFFVAVCSRIYLMFPTVNPWRSLYVFPVFLESLIARDVTSASSYGIN